MTRQDFDREIRRLDTLARLLDARFRLFGIRFGWDGIASIVPGLGDAVTLVPGAWLIWRARQLGVPTPVILRMAANTGIDFVGGSVPVLGTIFDVAFKSNLRNMALLRRHLEEEGRTS
ncbi:DUF4112 domain-containing protein [Cereibacter azotoformans]|uniref:Uncharacterized protein DUF4112 n=2 Tax=Cereibacter TaxID=1653176 RepID=A0A2T5KDL4_9RHOB|nr:DUF4112 domain-containing protein [Cereibacter azotoformans]AXQ93709.1 DUF4112 domain-containing protein [Cereibacter sphaeroides]MBO4168500.1 DUF4112 domain-containing protein [Cereibacter azotoformans]PTR20510.1 uncharacterized protein DUF4112 [Cereibacter azotoformans]UIJ29213.1 DUF4112 domain-containing protein [Cereibacter azotoformans]ULB09899.1 DUF4112 domain-containing protein [Cereibacter azotoformans]